MPRERTVFLKDEGIYAQLISEGAYASRVQYLYGGVLYDVLIDNSEIEYLEEDDLEE